MNKQNFQQTGGFPLKTDTLDKMQTAYEIFNALGEIAGNKAIIKGCTVAGSNISDGVVYIDGEIFKFVGGAIQSTVIILENVTSDNFENGDTNPVHYERYVTFASGVGSIPWSDFTRLTSIVEIQKRLLPVGVINMWSGSIANIPSGWVLCDGTNGTPNLKGRFIVGYDTSDVDYDAIGKTGGEKKHTLTISEMPSHRHIGLTFEGTNSDTGDPGSLITTDYNQSNGNQTQNGATTGYTGNNQAHENRPPYYTLAYIMFVGI